MLNFVVSLSLVLLSPGSVSIREAATDAHVRAVEPSSDVAETYEELRFKPVRERVSMVQQLSSSMQSAVWAHHFLTALTEHPEFTSEQRAVVQETLSLLTPELFEIDPSSPRWAELVDQPLRRIKERAKVVFTSKEARELFTQMGPDVRDGQMKIPSRDIDPNARNRRAGSPRFTPPFVSNDWPVCQCSTGSDWCSDWSGFGRIFCENVGGCYFSTRGCGALLLYACNGMCQEVPT